MGYAHYFDRAVDLPAGQFAAAVEDCRRVLAHTGIPLAGPTGSGLPIFDANQIAFNGPGQQGCETFCVDRRERPRNRSPRIGDFCKTNRRPYDLCVQAALIVFAQHFGEAFLVSSDGQDADWDAARKLCKEHLGYGLDFRLANRG